MVVACLGYSRAGAGALIFSKETPDLLWGIARCLWWTSRFSPDDIVKLPIHRAINLWVAQGVPRGGFLAGTLPMEELHNEHLAVHHAETQRRRGGHHPGPLGDPLLEIHAAAPGARPPRRRNSARSATHNSNLRGEPGKRQLAAPPFDGQQLTFADGGSGSGDDVL